MSNKSPIQHFNDYGFDPQIDYFHVLEEAKNDHNNKQNSSIDDAFKFNLQKQNEILHNNNKKKHRFLKNPLLFFKWLKWPPVVRSGRSHYAGDVHVVRANTFRAGSMSGPVCVSESRSGSSTPYRTMRTVTSAIPYLSLRELTMERQQRILTSSMSGPVCFVS
ncbi:unnamed protein product [Cochlearia groenlandica]